MGKFVYRRILKNEYAINMLNKIITLVFGFLSSIFITRYMGSSMKGEYAFIISNASILSIFLDLGVYQAYPNQVKRGLNHVEIKFVDIFVLQFIIYEFLGIVVGVASKESTILYVCILAPVMTLLSQVLMIAMIRFPIYRSISSIGVSVFNLIAYIVLFFTFPRKLFLVVFVLILKDIIFIVLILYKLKIVPNPFRVEKNILFGAIRFGVLPMITALLLNLNYKMDVIMVRNYSNSYNAGIYSVAVTIADYLWLVPDAFKEVLFSKSVQKKTTEIFNFAIKIAVYFTSALSLGLLLSGKWLIPIMYGKEFLGVYPIMALLLIGIPFMSVFKILSPLYVTQGDTKTYFWNLLFGVVCNYVGNRTLIPYLGLVGAAWATVFSQAVCGIFALLCFYKRNKISGRNLLVLLPNEIEFIKEFIGGNK